MMSHLLPSSPFIGVVAFVALTFVALIGAPIDQNCVEAASPTPIVASSDEESESFEESPLTSTGPAISITTDIEMAAQIDEILLARWQEEEIVPVDRSSDAEFLRRVWLDLAGSIPPLNEKAEDGDFGVRGFLADDRPDKRARLVDHLLARDSYGSHMATVWTNVMVPDEASVQRFGAGFHSWLRYKFRINEPYDALVSELLLARGSPGSVGPILFYSSNDLKPEELAAATSRVFLGVQIQCAQCHDHPSGDWLREEFWEFAAFFARLGNTDESQIDPNQVADVDEGELLFPESEIPIVPRFLRGEKSPDDERIRRRRLADWLTSPENEYFARAATNRAWAIMFGRGLVDPVDDLGEHNPARVPELLDALTEYFVATGFDMKRLFRTIVLTEAYQRTSRIDPNQDNLAKWFARMSLKSLTAEQLYDSLAEAMRNRDSTQFGDTQTVARGVDQNRVEFVSKFRAPTLRSVDFEAGIPQALTMMNGTVVRQATDIAQSDLLGSLDDPFFSNEKRLEIIFLSTLSRPPNEEEIEQLMPYVREGGATGNRRLAYSDILWAVLNSAEFVFNH